MDQPPNPNEWREIFDSRGAIIALFGFLGGTVNALMLLDEGEDWKTGVRAVVIGTCTAFGFGELTGLLLRQFGIVDAGTSVGIGIVSAMAFVVGLTAISIIERLRKRAKGEEEQ